MEGIRIKFGEKEFLVKPSFRSLMLFEEITGKNSSEIRENVTDTVTMFYCMVKASNKEFTLTLEEFIDLVDTYTDTLDVFVEYLKSQAQPQEGKKKVQRK